MIPSRTGLAKLLCGIDTDDGSTQLTQHDTGGKQCAE